MLEQKEADRLILMIKRYFGKQSFKFPGSNGKICFDVIGDTRKDAFTVNIDRKREGVGCSAQGRVKADNTMLMRIDFNPSSVHFNKKTGEKLIGSHVHFYDEEYGDYAVPLDIAINDAFETCGIFFDKFNIKLPPHITNEPTLFS